MRKSFGPDGQFIFDSTSLTTASACLRKYYYTMILNLEPGNESVHLLFGRIYASAIELYHHRRAAGESHDAALVAAVRAALTQSWGPKGPLNFEHSAKTRENLVRTVILYLDSIDKTDFETYILKDGKPAVELSFIVPFNDDFAYAGHLDRVVTISDDLFWLDNKTTSKTLGPWFFDSFKPSHQFYGYSYAGTVILGEPFRGGVIDGAQIAVGFSRFEREIINVTKDQLEEWVDTAAGVMYGVRDAFRQDRWPMNLASCGNYGGCPFRELCSKPPSIREKFIEGSFKTREEPWDPATPR